MCTDNINILYILIMGTLESGIKFDLQKLLLICKKKITLKLGNSNLYSFWT